MGLVFVVSKIPKYKQRWYNTDSPIMMRLNQTERAPLNDTPAKVTSGRTMSFNQAFLPYYLLIGITVLCLLVPPIYNALSVWKVALTFPETATAFGYMTKAEPYFSPVQPLTYAGTFLLLSALSSLWYYEKRNFYLNQR